jgi:hypothetical protein
MRTHKICLQALALLCFAGYCVWNVSWLVQAQVPPSLITWLTGLPCPTTGGTRALGELLQGNLAESMRYNCMAVPLMLLFGGSLGLLAWQTISRQRLRLPPWMCWAWLVTLSAAWFSKLAGDPSYW